jgi:hypothetical protein
MSWIKFVDAGESQSGKTKIWILTTPDDERLGMVKWFARWRKYAFHPAAYTVIGFDEDCLREIASFLERETAGRGPLRQR